jgi:hypothetical protein
VPQTGDPWKSIQEMNIETLRPVIENESTEVAAVVLSKLKAVKAVEFLGAIPARGRVKSPMLFRKPAVCRPVRLIASGCDWPHNCRWYK